MLHWQGELPDWRRDRPGRDFAPWRASWSEERWAGLTAARGLSLSEHRGAGVATPGAVGNPALFREIREMLKVQN